MANPFWVLAITDGTTRVNLLQKRSGFHLTDWAPAVTAPKGDGVWRDSPLADGRRLAMQKRQNVIETYTLQVRNWSPDDLIKDTQDLRRLLEKAITYRTAQWQGEPVWIEAQGMYEENLRYSLIEDYRAPADGYPYGGSFWNALGQAAFADWLLVLEREPFWRSVPPGQPCPESRNETQAGCFPAYLDFYTPPAIVNCGSDPTIDDLPDDAFTLDGWVRAAAPVPGSDSPVIAGTGDGAEFWRSQDNGATWALVGNAAGEGQIRSLVLAANGDVIAGTGTGAEFWRSQDDGATWTQVGNAAGENSIFSLVLAANGDIIAGTDPGAEFWRSQDNGATWALVGNAAGEQTICCLVLAANGDVIAGTLTTDVDAEFWRSQDNGATWAQVGSATGEEGILSLVLAANGDIIAGTDLSAEFWRSQDDGATWAQVGNAAGEQTIHCLVLAANGDIIAGTYPNAEFWRSQDDGATWAQVDSATGEDAILSLVLAANGDIIAGTSPNAEFWRSQDDGATWAQVSNAAGESDVYSLVLAGRSFTRKGDVAEKTGHLLTGWQLSVNPWLGLSGGVYCTDGGAIAKAWSSGYVLETNADDQWHHVTMFFDDAGARLVYLALDGNWLTNYASQQAAAGIYDADADNDLLIGNNSVDEGCFDPGWIGWLRLSDNDRFNHGTDFTPPPRCELPDIDANTMMLVIYEGAGATTHDLSGNDNDGAITDCEWDCDCDYTDEVDVECNCVQASGEQSWAYEDWSIHDGNPVGVVNDIIETEANVLVACEESSNVWRSVDGSAPWVAAAGPPAPNVQCRAMVEASDGYIYLVGNNTVTGQVECWRSGDDGNNWISQNNNVAGAAATVRYNCIDEGDDGYLYAATSVGIFRSADGGTTWNPVYTATAAYTMLNGSDGNLYSLIPQKIIRSENGINWSPIFYDGAPIGEMIVEPDTGRFFASFSAAGPFDPRLRSEGGTIWNLIEIASEPFMDLIRSSDGFLYGITESGDILRANDGVLVGEWDSVFNIAAASVPLLEYSQNSRIYAGSNAAIYISPQSITVGRFATCLDETVFSNKQNIAQLTDIFVYDASTTTYIDQFPAGAFPYFLLPSPLGAGDIVYFGINRDLVDSGPFCSLVFDIYQSLILTGANTLIWEYGRGGGLWGTLNVSDGTAVQYPFARPGVNTVVWAQPSDFTTQAINFVTAFWIRLRVDALGTWHQSPMQQYRDVYTVNWPCVEIDELQVQGDVPALLQIKAHNRSDEDAYESIVDELDLLDNRIICGLRSTGRGRFALFINCGDDSVVLNRYTQNLPGISVNAGTGTLVGPDPTTPCGVTSIHTTQGNGLTNYDDALTITFGPSIARDFYGEYHAFLRAQLYEPETTPAGDHDDVRVRLKVQSGTGGVIFYTDYKQFVGWDAWDGAAGREETYKDWQLLDFKEITLPVTTLLKGTELPDQFTVTVQVASAAATNLRVEMYDLVLIPVDEWAGDFVDTALEDDSGVSNGYALDVDSVTFPKRDIRALVRTADASELLKSVYQPVTPNPAVLQANADQRLWFLSARGVYLGYQTGGGPGAATLTDSYADFPRAGVKPGTMIWNLTDGSSGPITAVTQTTITATLAGGVGNDWDDGDEYLIVCPCWRSEPWVVHSVQLWHVARYLSMRGAR